MASRQNFIPVGSLNEQEDRIHRNEEDEEEERPAAEQKILPFIILMRLHGSVQQQRTAIDFKPFLQESLALQHLPEEREI